MNLKSIIAMLCIAVSIAMLGGCEQQKTSGGKVDGLTDKDLFQLAHMNGCIECHTVSATSVGPSWQAIADRYKDAPREDARQMLIESVKKGSKGKWLTWKGGDGMPPLERRVSEQHIGQLVDFILSLNQSGDAQGK